MEYGFVRNLENPSQIPKSSHPGLYPHGKKPLLYFLHCCEPRGMYVGDRASTQSFLQWSSEFLHTWQVVPPSFLSRQSWQKPPACCPLQNESARDFTGNSEELQFEMEKEAMNHYGGFVL